VVSESTPPRRPVLTLDDLARPLTRRPERLHALTAAELPVAFSQGLDLGEGKTVGHAQRVCYIATALADALALDPVKRAGVFFGSLLHDAGVTPAGAELCRVAGVDESTVFGPSPLRARDDDRAEFVFADRTAVQDAVEGHGVLGAETVRALDLPEEAAAAVAAHHENWDGCGYPEQLAGEAIPIEGRIVAVADVAEVVIAEEFSSLVARRHFHSSIARFSGAQLDPRIITILLDLANSDEFWLGLYSEDLAATLGTLRGTGDARKSRKRVTRFAEVFAGLSDAKGDHTTGHSLRTADNAERLAKAVGLDAGHVEMIRIAGLLHDVGLLGVPARVLTKPDILSVSEMQLMRQHPANSEMILQELPGFEEVAVWISRHHERPDGKGYPEMLTGDDIPMESRILAIADVYAALMSERPHRAALAPGDAKQVLLGAAGTQLDAELVRTFCQLL
jgi:HD-GYP domain-containing protein (c-di-GMP phosphodiesterase class II)